MDLVIGKRVIDMRNKMKEESIEVKMKKEKKEENINAIASMTVMFVLVEFLFYVSAYEPYWGEGLFSILKVVGYASMFCGYPLIYAIVVLMFVGVMFSFIIPVLYKAIKSRELRKEALIYLMIIAASLGYLIFGYVMNERGIVFKRTKLFVHLNLAALAITTLLVSVMMAVAILGDKLKKIKERR